MDKTQHLIGIDIGGTKISVCVGTRKGEILAVERFPTADEPRPEHGVERIHALAMELLEKRDLRIDDIAAVGMGAPGPLSVSEGVIRKTPNMPSWRGAPIVRLLTGRFGLPVYFNNDANACALAEFEFGDYRGVHHMVYLTASTGVGGGVIANGKILQGAVDAAGEVGHMVLDPDGPACGCGLRGCFEVYCGGKCAAELAQRDLIENKPETRVLSYGDGTVESLDMKVLTAAARDGDAWALARWDAFMERWAQGVGAVLMSFNPEVVLFGTIALYVGDFFFDPLREKLPKYAWKENIESCILAPSSLGARIGDLGALAIAVSHLE